MALRGMHLILAAVVAVCGCAGQLTGPTAENGRTLRLLADSTQVVNIDPRYDDELRPPAEPSGSYVAIGDDDRDVEETPSIEADSAPNNPAPPAEPAEALAPLDDLAPVEIVAQRDADSLQFPQAEELVTPAPAPVSRFKSQPPEEDFDRFRRQIVDVPVDIRPSEGVLPEDIGAEKFAAEPTIDETFPSDQPADIFCSYTPWTICYRPLYFEDIGLERYGKNVGCLQTGLSGVRFFGSVAALPYKMTRRRPRSCECSNGFSRPGDCPLPGYGNRRFEWDAALVEAAVVTGFVYFIP